MLKIGFESPLHPHFRSNFLESYWIVATKLSRSDLNLIEKLKINQKVENQSKDFFDLLIDNKEVVFNLLIEKWLNLIEKEIKNGQIYVKRDQNKTAIIIDNTIFVVRFKSDWNRRLNSHCLESESSRIQFVGPKRLSLADWSGLNAFASKTFFLFVV